MGKENGISANEMSSQTEERLKRLEEGNDIIQRFILSCSFSNMKIVYTVKLVCNDHEYNKFTFMGHSNNT